MDFVETLTNPQFLTAVFAAIAAGAVVFTFGSQFFEKSDVKERIKRVALEREKLRNDEMTRLRGAEQENKPSIRGGREAKAVVTRVVQRFDLQKAFADENTQALLQQAGYRGQGPLTTYVFLRFVSPMVFFVLALVYLGFLAPGGRPLFLNVLYAIMVGLLGSYLPLVLLRNQIQKRQQSIRRAWPDCLDLMLLCVEAGMSVEHAFKRVAKEIGAQSVPLAEELTLTTAELSFLDDRTRAYDNLGKRTGLDGVRAVMTALIQAERYGTSVGQSLRIMAEEGREMRMNEAEKKAASLPPKLTVPLILFFLPVLFIVIMAPAMIKIFSQNISFNI